MVNWRIRVETEIADLASYQYKYNEKSMVKIVEFRLKGAISPDAAKDFAELIQAYITRFVKPENNDLVVLAGRGPIWLYMLAQHYLHGQISNLGVFDPKIGIVVVAAHGWDSPFSEGQLIPKDQIPDEILAALTQPPAKA